MHVAVSDYDGTICTHGSLVGEVVPAINRWREAGNRFGIATGRDLTMTLFETDSRDIPFDFLICDNGAEIYDHQAEPLARRQLDDSLVPALLRHPAARDSMHILISSGRMLRAVVTPASWFPRMGVPYREINLEQASVLDGLSQISLAFPTTEKCLQWSAILTGDFTGLVRTHPNHRTIDITAPGTDKASGIRDLLAFMKWEDSRVHTIGDAANDIPMIREYGGYTVPGASEEVMLVATRTFDSVADMLARV